jgi:hypothetical protein
LDGVFSSLTEENYGEANQRSATPSSQHDLSKKSFVEASSIYLSRSNQQQPNRDQQQESSTTRREKNVVVGWLLF